MICLKKKTHTPKLKYHVLNRNEWNKLISIKMHSKSKKNLCDFVHPARTCTCTCTCTRTRNRNRNRNRT